MTAENPARAGGAPRARPRFNEAAADDRGKPAPGRPLRRTPGRFNEAAADDRGKPPTSTSCATPVPSLQ